VKLNISIVPFEEHAKVNFYSIIIDNNINSEIEEFLDKIEDINESDAAKIVYALDKISKNGAQERLLRYEGKISDNVFALPAHYLIETDFRLYLLKYTESIVILGNGGIKQTDTYQEDQYLNRCVTILQKVDEQIQRFVKSRDIVISGKTITGETDFTIYI
jgi:hypothetical protein